MNASDQDVTINADSVVGRAYELDEEELVAEELDKFYQNVSKYKRPVIGDILFKAKYRLSELVKTNMSKPIIPDNITLESFLTTRDLMKHEFRSKLKTLKFNNNLSFEQKSQLAEVILNNHDVFTILFNS